ncbi:uncharacterized protein B0H18DRAFT_986240 [Fomitopsis serialis]|uniref:uncharacterized protein n=1 Tax=Fomitopsis serialis TaxID=139415 RepID=UPI002007D57F|nr:uncharacterized protein B0H18DRAFT_986240 [Neoantrodia serialis]KAH9932563.1 hypothetical protein B0H18DRAFT_986240 [Neoantrodia serialis]
MVRRQAYKRAHAVSINLSSSSLKHKSPEVGTGCLLLFTILTQWFSLTIPVARLFFKSNLTLPWQRLLPTTFDTMRTSTLLAFVLSAVALPAFASPILIPRKFSEETYLKYLREYVHPLLRFHRNHLTGHTRHGGTPPLASNFIRHGPVTHPHEVVHHARVVPGGSQPPSKSDRNVAWAFYRQSLYHDGGDNYGRPTGQGGAHPAEGSHPQSSGQHPQSSGQHPQASGQHPQSSSGQQHQSSGQQPHSGQSSGQNQHSGNSLRWYPAGPARCSPARWGKFHPCYKDPN